MALNSDQSLPGRTFPQYFTELSANYARSTGNSTYKVFAEYLRTTRPQDVNPDAIINDNGSGPGVATAAIIEYLGGAEPRSIVAHDNVPAMVAALDHRIQAMGWRNVRGLEADSHALADFADDTFTVAVSNINISTYRDPGQCLQEMRRTLKPDGLAIVTMWKRFGAAELIHEAQKLVRSDAKLMVVPKAEFMQHGYLEKVMKEAGFRETVTTSVSVLCKGAEVEGIRDFMCGDFTRTVRAPWNEAEREQWPRMVDKVIKDETAAYGGVRFEAWVVTGRK